MIVSTVLLLALAAEPGTGLVWPQHRGPGGLGIAGAKAPLPDRFAAREGFAWKTALPPGKSSPILAGGKIFLTAHEGNTMLTLCIDPKTGAILWRKGVERSREEKRNRLNDPAAPTPVTDGALVYSFFADFGLVAYDLNGEEKWRVPLGPYESEHGMAAWPAVGSESIFVQADVTNGSYLAAFDKKTGRQRWKLDRRNTVGAYASPLVHREKGKPEVVIASGPFEMAAFDAKTGEKVWWVNGLPFQPKSVPVVVGDVVYMNSLGIDLPWPDHAGLLQQYDKDGNGILSKEEATKYFYIRANFDRLDENRNATLEKEEWDPLVRGNNATLAVRITGKGDQTANILWRHKKSLPDVPQPLVHDGVLYYVRDGGIFVALDAATGRVLKQGRLPGAIDQYFSSPVYGDGKLYVSSASGMLTVIRAGRAWEIVSTNDLDEPLWATPAIDGSNMYIRAGNSLYCFRGSAADRSNVEVTKKLDPEGVAKFAGAYKFPNGFETSIEIEDGVLLLHFGRADVELVRTGELTFDGKQRPPMKLRFVEEAGKIQSVSLEQNGRTTQLTRSPGK